MTTEQREALSEMSRRSIGAVWTPEGWKWACDVRENEADARLVLTALGHAR